MISALISLLIAVIVLGVIFWAVQQLLAIVPMDPRFKTVANVLIVLIAVLVVVWVLLDVVGMAGVHVPYRLP
jgi:hypothetical protein